jgi:HtrA serine peptidase 2
VTLQDGRNFEGEVVSFDSLSDLAVIKVNSSRPLPVVKLGTSKDLRPGEWVVALGSPLHLQNTVTAGIISCVDRKSAEIGLEGVGTGYIQTDAAINQGNSGGPLLNLDGEVIGINTMKALAADGVSFAIPIDSAIKIVDQLKKRRHVIRPWLGMKMWELTEPRILQLKERRPGFPNVTAGILVSQVIPGSPASRAGVHNDDVIIEFNGVPVTNINQIVEALGDKVGTSFKMLVKRKDDEQVVLYVTAEEASPDF